MVSPENVPIISTATPEDAEAIRELAVEARIDAWSAADYRAEIEREGSLVLVARSVSRSVDGFLVARVVPGQSEHPDADLYNIAVRENSRRAGVGGKLLKTLISFVCERGVENVWLEVRASNRDAIHFYENNGFRAEVTRPNFYSNSVEDAVVMRLILKNAPESTEVSKA